ncbi:MAG TPA: hypothetical protein VMK84_27090 [Streptosporangiaceae bacterium]|nr:hypothetical protein [Streptosporangiaceae bacterium]
MRRNITRALYATAVAAITLGTLGFARAGSPATAASRFIGLPGYSPSWAGCSVARRTRVAPRRAGMGGAAEGCGAGVLLSGQVGGYGGDTAERQPVAPG